MVAEVVLKEQALGLQLFEPQMPLGLELLDQELETPLKDELVVLFQALGLVAVEVIVDLLGGLVERLLVVPTSLRVIFTLDGARISASKGSLKCGAQPCSKS